MLSFTNSAAQTAFSKQDRASLNKVWRAKTVPRVVNDSESENIRLPV